MFGLNTGKYRPEKTPYLETFPYHLSQDKNLANFMQVPIKFILEIIRLHCIASDQVGTQIEKLKKQKSEMSSGLTCF